MEETNETAASFWKSIINKIQTKHQIMEQNMSALKKHFLASILPYQDRNQSEYFVKSKEFYKPQQFIWNNPHRTCKKMFSYYHESKNIYDTQVKPIILGLEEQDRINIEQERIRKLIQLRNDCRAKFFQRQKSREQLEAKSNSRRASNSITIEAPTYRSNCSPKVVSTSTYITGTIQQSYKRSVEKYDKNLSKIKKMVNDQIARNHENQRQEFQKRKVANDSLNNSLIRVEARKTLDITKQDLQL